MLHILWSGAVGGAQRAVFQLIQSQLARGVFEPAAAFAQPEGPYYEKIRDLGVEVVALDLPGDRRPYRAWDIRRKIRRFPIHHFHSAEITVMLASLGCRDAVRVFTQRGGTTGYGWLKRLRHRIVGSFLRRSFHGFSGNTRHACESGSTLFGIAGSRWQVTYNGLDFSAFDSRGTRETAAREIGLPLDDAVVIGSAAQLRPWKRIDWIFRACARLPRERFRILILGDGPDRARLEALAERLHLADRTVFAGMRTGIGDFLALMDVFVLPSTHLESFGNAAVEAMSQGLPALVACDSGGMVEHIRDGETGYLVDSVETLSGRLQTLIDDPELRRTLGHNARDFIRQTYTFEKMASSYERLYRSALEYAGRPVETNE